MVDKVTISTPVEAVQTLERMMGFVPESSFAVMGMRGQCARVDLGEPDFLREALKPVNDWKQVIVFLYGKREVTQRFSACAGEILPGAELVTVIEVDGLTVRHGYEEYVIYREHLTTRETLVSEAAELADRDAAFAIAQEAYDQGDGARSWVFLDRAQELGYAGDDQDDLEYKLLNAIPPPMYQNG